MEQYHCHAEKSWRKSCDVLVGDGKGVEERDRSTHGKGRYVAVGVDLDGELPGIPISQSCDDGLQSSRCRDDDVGFEDGAAGEQTRGVVGDEVCSREEGWV